MEEIQKTTYTLNNFDRWKDKFYRGSKYLLEWFAIVLAAKFIPEHELSWKEIMIIAIIGAVVFAVLDIYVPSISSPVKNSTGIVVGMRTLTL